MKKWTVLSVAVFSLFLIGGLLWQEFYENPEEIVLYNEMVEEISDGEAVDVIEDIADGEDSDSEANTGSDLDGINEGDTDKEDTGDIDESDLDNTDGLDNTDEEDSDIEEDANDINDSDIEEEALDTLIQPLALLTSWNITIDIPDYDPIAGRLPWPLDATKDAIIDVDFWTMAGTDKRIRIQLAEGFRFVKYPVLTVQYTDREIVADGELWIVLESVTSKPQKQTAYATYNSGYLEYKITPTTTQVEIKNISFTVDEIVYYGSDKVLTGAIKITSLVDGQQMNEVTMDIKQSNTPATSRTCSITQINHTYLSGTQFNTESLGCVLRLGFLYTKYSTYIKNKKVYYYYPTALQFVSASPAGTYTHYPASGLVVFDTPNSAYLTLSTTGVLPGTYTAPVITYQEIEMYDGTIIRINFKNLSVVVQDAATLINKLTLQTANRNYNPDLWPDFWIQWPGFGIYNADIVPKTNQIMAFTVGTGYEVRQISFPRGTNTAPSYIEWATWSGLTGLAVGNEIIKTYNTSSDLGLAAYGYGVSTTSLGLPNGEYIKYAKAPLGDISWRWSSNAYKYDFYNRASMYLMGRLASGVNSATVNVQTWADGGSGGILSGTQNSITGTVTRNTNTSQGYRLVASTSNTTVTAGQTLTRKMSLREPDNAYRYGDLVAFINPTIYIRKPAGVEVYSGSIIVKKIGGTNIPFTVDEYTTSQGANIVAIHIPTNIWLYFNGAQEPGVEVSFDFRPTIETMGNINWHDYIVADNSLYHNYGAQNGTLGVIADTYDANNNGNKTEQMMRLNTATTQIVAANVLLMDTYLIPDGGSRQPSYNPAQPATAVAFTPGTVGKYEVVFDNQRSNTVGSLVYLPIPRVGNNFWPNFQSTGFSRNMKLWGQPNITVYDQYGTNVTATRAGNYEIRYSNNATDANNYASATYGTNYNGATMIRMKNDMQMLAGEKVVLSFDYIVDEANSSDKVWLINDFMPYYYFEAGNIWRTNGSRVGAMLQVGSIWGMLFLDENADGIYNTGEIKLTNKTVNLYKGTTYQTTVQTDLIGNYLFSGLSNGVYKVDFNDALTSWNYAYFTLKGTGADTTQNSKVEYLGANVGYVLNVDPVQLSSTTLNAGILNYDPDTDLTITLNTTGTTLTLTITGSNPTTGLIATLTPTFFDQIQATANSTTRSSNNPTVASVSSTGLIEGKQAGTATITLTIKDLRWNTKTTTALITVENKIPLSCDINYSPSTNTNTNVVATLTSCNKPIMVTNNGGSTTYVFTGNGVFTFTYQDTYGNTWSTTATVNRIDKTPIVPTITYTATGRTNQDVTATISFNKSGVTVTPPYEGGQGGSGWYHTFTGNGSFTFTYQDAYGNNGSEIATVTRIDKISPTCDVSYSPATNTNGNVVASLTNCSETIIVTNTPNTNYTFTGNGSFTFQFSDPAGNTGSALATVTRIDASAIQATISYTPDTATSGNVQSLISFNKTWVSITSTSGATTTTLANDTSLFTDNGTFAYTYQDTFGNTGSSVAVVNRIDKTAPTCTVTYTPSTNTNQDVVASLTNCSETITWTAISHTFTSNDSFTFTFTDLVGNTWSTTATVTWINKTAIVSTITYSTTGATSGDVTASISFNKTGVTVNPPYEGGQGGSGWYHTFTDNGSFTFTYQDAYGNQGSETAIVSRIDKTAPTCSIIYTPNTNTNQNVIASLTNCSETITVLPPYEGGQGGSGTTYTFTGNDSFTFSFSDLVGNTGSTTATVNRIDKTAIIPTIAYDITGATNQNVTATLSFNKSWITITSDGGDSHLFTTTGSFTFHFHDGYGNTGSALATVTRIDKTAPILTLSYSPNTATNQPVLVTLSTDEPVTRPAGWSGNATGTTFTKIYIQDVSEPVTIYDLVGNQGQKWLTIDWIDSTPVTGSVSYSTPLPTNGNVAATISFNKSGVVVTNNSWNLTYTFISNGTFAFEFTDTAGNTGTETATVTRISSLEDKYLICASIADIPEIECKALVDFYYSTHGDEWTKGFSGDSVGNKSRLTGNQACNWLGIVCDTAAPKHVIEITLNSNNLSGELPITLANLEKMQTFALIGNDIRWILPDALAARTNIQSFRMERNQLQGKLPKAWSTWTNIKLFYVSQNQLTGILPKERSTWTKMQRLSVRDNHIWGILPPERLTWTEIYYFYVYNNEIEGTLPTSYASWTGVVDFYTHTNRMSGTLPKEYQARERIEDVRIQNNGYEGDVPAERWLWNTLKKLYLGNNTLTWQFPEHWTALTSVFTGEVNVDNNCLTTTLTEPLSSWMDEKSQNGSGWRLTQSHCPVIPPTDNGNSWWGGWGGSLTKDHCLNGDFSPSYYDSTCEDNENEEHGAAGTGIPPSPLYERGHIYETAYERAKEYGITTASTYEDARTTDAILRQEMAKMISTYAIKLFQKTPDTEKIDCSQFKDLAQAGGDLQPYVIQSCQLGLMGMNGDGIGVQENFSPKSSITRAEFGTVLSRLLRGTTYASQLGDETYYGRHLQALKKAGIMNFISNPDMLELRGNILLMLWKSVGK